MGKKWASINGYDYDYRISESGVVERLVIDGDGNDTYRIIPSHDNGHGYFIVSLGYKGKYVTRYIHRISYEAFNKTKIKKGYQVDHIDNNKLNNKSSNLQMLSPRENVSKHYVSAGCGYPGVFHVKGKSKFTVRIFLDGKQTYLGTFDSFIDAKNAYDNTLVAYNNLDK